MRRQLITVFSCAFLLGAAAPAFAQEAAAAPAQSVREKVNEAMTWYRGLPAEERSMEALQSKIDELFADVDVSQFGIDELKAVPGYYAGPALREKLKARINELKQRDDAEGAAASAMTLESAREGGAEAVSYAFSEAANHPGLGAALAKGWATEVFNVVASIPAEVRAEVADDVVALAQQFEAELPPSVMTNAIAYVTGLVEFGDAIDPAVREDIRSALVARVEAAAKTAEDERLAKYLADSVKVLNGAYARGELVGHQAPDVTITWFSGEGEVASLGDLKGKVVVVDFWATWCGPCVASFPNIRELQERYDGYDVAIVGITSLQGYHITPDRKRIPENSQETLAPEREYELMPEYMRQQDITWLVAFTEENVFNPDFGVRGIPHMAIIDSEGIVRYRGMHPAGSTLAEKAEKIDGLLKEAGLPAPPPLSAETPESADDGH